MRKSRQPARLAQLVEELRDYVMRFSQTLRTFRAGLERTAAEAEVSPAEEPTR